MKKGVMKQLTNQSTAKQLRMVAALVLLTALAAASALLAKALLRAPRWTAAA
ncbi:hypothetical protein [Paraburkholderia sp. SIMBA_054]|uniref:hypothetical protein n=1 Tax=Paraburkholderia sp. SIMBA_054 TaxID=3085795 RepID=UPI00397B46BE